MSVYWLLKTARLIASRSTAIETARRIRRSYQAEAANGALEGLLLSPADKGAVFLGKAAAAFVQLIILLLGRMLGEQGVRWFDMTPGGDYKERFASDFDQVVERQRADGEGRRGVDRCQAVGK